MQTAKHDVQELRRQVRAKLDALPQRPLIADSDVKFWSEEVVERYGELALWHATRVGGFGGSQIGTLVRNSINLRADFSSAHDIVELCLLRRLPDEPNGHMQRGVWMEPHHRQMFYAKWSARRDAEGFDKLSKGVGMREWMRYSPDELCFMPGAAAGIDKPWIRVLGDFKAPSQAHEVNFEYQCQLAMGNLICRHLGVQVDALMLSQFNWAEWELEDRWIDVDEEVEKAIVAAGDHYWNDYVMAGRVPAYVRKPRLDPSAQQVQEMAAPMGELSRMKALAAWVKDNIERLEGEVKPKLAELRFAGAKLELGGLSWTAQTSIDMEQAARKLPLEVLEALPLQAKATKRWDEDKLLAAVRETVPPEGLKDFLKPGNLEPAAMYDALVAHGLDADAIVTEKLVARVNKSVSESTTAWIEGQMQRITAAGRQPAANQEVADEGGDSEQDDREGQSPLRHVPSSRS